MKSITDFEIRILRPFDPKDWDWYANVWRVEASYRLDGEMRYAKMAYADRPPMRDFAERCGKLLDRERMSYA